jgi:hypothetical protein
MGSSTQHSSSTSTQHSSSPPAPSTQATQHSEPVKLTKVWNIAVKHFQHHLPPSVLRRSFSLHLPPMTLMFLSTLGSNESYSTLKLNTQPSFRASKACKNLEHCCQALSASHVPVPPTTPTFLSASLITTWIHLSKSSLYQVRWISYFDIMLLQYVH